MLRFDQVMFKRGGFTLSADCTVRGPGITALIGPSGGGKSTLLSLIAGFEQPDSGRISADGEDLADRSPGNRPVAILFQDNNLFPHLDALANVALGVSPRVRPSPDVKRRAKDALERVGLIGLEDRRPSDLSGGQQSRVALARILLTDRPVVLMDEAFSALGPAQRVEMLELVASVLPDATILMVTHDPEDAKRIARETIFVEDGVVHPPVDTGVLFANPNQDMARYLS